MRKLTIIMLILISRTFIYGQNVAINGDGSDPHPSAMLDVKSTSKGLLFPRMTQVQRDAIVSPATGLLIFQTDNTPGFYYYNGVTWSSVIPSTNNLWSLNGNAGTDPANNFIGTTDNTSLLFKVNNQQAGKIDIAKTSISFGLGALSLNTTGQYNAALGSYALQKNTIGESNVAMGYASLNNNTTGIQNTASGTGALSQNTIGNANTALGASALSFNTTGYLNVAGGLYSLLHNTIGVQNSAWGTGSLINNTTGNDNTAIGNSAMIGNTTGNENTLIGSNANVFTGNLTNATAIGAKSRVDCDNCLILGSVNGINSATSDVKVGIGTSNPNTSSILELSSTNKGLLIPRMTQAERDVITSPANGLMIYQTDNIPGFYYNNGTSSTPDWIAMQNANNGWALGGNIITNGGYVLGTKNNFPLQFITNNVLSGTINHSTGNTFFGYEIANAGGGVNNVAVGDLAMHEMQDGGDNVALGNQALFNSFGGSWNVAVGNYSLTRDRYGMGNTAVGTNADVLSDHLNNATAIGSFSEVGCDNCLVLGSNNLIYPGRPNTRVGIGTSNPNSSAALEINSNEKGLLIPRMTQLRRDAIISPSTGLLVYQTDGTAGFHYYNGTAWTSLAANTSTNNLWSTQGNAGTDPANNFIGTIDNQPLVLKVNNDPAGIIDQINDNVFLGHKINAGNFDTPPGNENVAIGNRSLFYDFYDQTGTGGFRNVAVGTEAMHDNTVGEDNVALGYHALHRNIGQGNIAIGSFAGQWTSGSSNTLIGYGAGNYSSSSGSSAYNTVVGANSLTNNRHSSYITVLGASADIGNDNLANATAIGYGAIVNASNKVRIGNSQITVIEGQVPFTTPSDARYKFNVQEDVKGLDFILKLRPVTYQFDTKKLDEELQPKGVMNANYKLPLSYNESSQIRRTGFIAQEVEKAADETGYTFSGIIKPKTERDHYGLSYESFVVPLVKAVQEQQKQIEDLKKENTELKKIKDELESLKKIVEKLSVNK